MRRRTLLLLLILSCFALGLSAQSHNWQRSSFTSHKLHSVEKSKDTVTITYRSTVVDTFTYKNDSSNIFFSRNLNIDSTIRYERKRGLKKIQHLISGYITGKKYPNDTSTTVELKLKFPILIDTFNKVGDFKDVLNKSFGSNVPGPCSTVAYTSKIDTSKLSRKALRRKYNYFFYQRKDNPLWYMSINGGTQIAYRIVFVNDPAFDKQSLIDERQQKESTILGHVLTAQGGIRLHGGNYLTASAIYLAQGFKTDHSAVDWTTGLPIASSNKKYHFNFWGVGVGYTHCNYTKKVSFQPDMGLSLLWATNSPVAGLRRRILVGYFGLGANIRISKNISLSIVPTEYYDFTAISKGMLLTRLNNLGINVGLDVHFWRKK